MLSRETIQTALENVESTWEALNNKMGQSEKSRYKRVIEELRKDLEQRPPAL